MKLKDYSNEPDPKLKCMCGKLLSAADPCPMPQGKRCPNLTQR